MLKTTLFRTLALIILTTLSIALLSACGSRVSSVSDTVKFALSGSEDTVLTPAQIDELTYATQYAKFKGSGQSVIVLAFIDKSENAGYQEQWAGQGNEIIVTRNGRLHSTRNIVGEFTNVKYELIKLVAEQPDPLFCLNQQATKANSTCPLSWQAKATVKSEHKIKNYNLSFQLSTPVADSIVINGERLESMRVEESVSAVNNVGKVFSFENTYWIADGQVIKSRQQLVPEIPKLDTEMLKRIKGLI
ncbi:YjbF family lipoprotein [Idiomarina sp.]|uniref:YjbF family lipoprotein n=1 Tax=Idiomarina sp. TaxID=1874361 RepID=UPI002EAABFBF|nr:YjbF family lipoprotein [Pseudomonadota bacterium]